MIKVFCILFVVIIYFKLSGNFIKNLIFSKLSKYNLIYAFITSFALIFFVGCDKNRQYHPPFIPVQESLKLNSVEIVCNNCVDSQMNKNISFAAQTEQWLKEKFLYNRQSGQYSLVINANVRAKRFIKSDTLFNYTVSYVFAIDLVFNVVDISGDIVGSFVCADGADLTIENFDKEDEINHINFVISDLLRKIDQNVVNGVKKLLVKISQKKRKIIIKNT